MISRSTLRRTCLSLAYPAAAVALGLAALSGPAAAGATVEKRHHALSLIGEPKFGPDFKHFDWVNPAAPKGGTLRQAAVGGFDSLNPFSIKGAPAAGLMSIYDTLMFSSPDEPSAEYGLVAEWVSYPDDYARATFGLRPEARFHDGTPMTADDVVWSLEQLKKVHPYFNGYYKNVVKAEKTGEREVTFTFDKAGNRELPHIMGQLPVLPRHFWTGTKADGTPRDLAASTLEPPLGSGAYKIKSLEPNREIVYVRDPNYWAKDLPVMAGQNNFDEQKFVYFMDQVPAFEAFKTGEVDYWTENRAANWATQYFFDAVKKGLITKETLAHGRVTPMQAFVFNTRHAKFQDPRVRRAFNHAFNFEEANSKAFYGQYVRVGSFFENSELAARGLPEGRELEILNEIKGAIPDDVFTTQFKNPVNVAPGDFRNNLRQASDLLREAGWTLPPMDKSACGIFCRFFRLIGLTDAPTQRFRVNTKGETLDVEILLNGQTFERVVLPFVGELKKLGINARVRTVDDAQYENRVKSFTFDMIVDNFGQSHSPGNEQRSYWGSAFADQPGSRNSIGIKSPAIDKLIDKVVFATDRAELIAATRALDRTLLASHFVVPHWHYPFERVAVWDVFGRPAKLPAQNPSYLEAWWIEDAKVKALAEKRR